MVVTWKSSSGLNVGFEVAGLQDIEELSEGVHVKVSGHLVLLSILVCNHHWLVSSDVVKANLGEFMLKVILVTDGKVEAIKVFGNLQNSES